MHRLRVGVGGEGDPDSITSNTQRAARCVDALAMQETSLREVVYRGERLGALGAAIAARQAKQLGLVASEKTVLGRHCFRIVFRADVVVNMLRASPSLARLMSMATETAPAAPPP